MLWEVVPQPNGALEKGVEVGVDRRQWDPTLEVIISSCSADGGKGHREVSR